LWKIHNEIILVLYIVMQVFNFCLLTRPIFYSFIYLRTLSVSQTVRTTPISDRTYNAYLRPYVQSLSQTVRTKPISDRTYNAYLRPYVQSLSQTVRTRPISDLMYTYLIPYVQRLVQHCFFPRIFVYMRLKIIKYTGENVGRAVA
jgi:hypothetical protein